MWAYSSCVMIIALSTVDHGSATDPLARQPLAWSHWQLRNILGLWINECCHSGANGRAISLSARASSSLVRDFYMKEDLVHLPICPGSSSNRNSTADRVFHSSLSASPRSSASTRDLMLDSEQWRRLNF